MKTLKESLFDDDLINTDPITTDDLKKSVMEIYRIHKNQKNKKDIEYAIIKWVEFVNNKLIKYLSNNELQDVFTSAVIDNSIYQKEATAAMRYPTKIDGSILLFRIGGGAYYWDNEDKEWYDY